MPEWKQEYSVGVVALDEQHKELFRLHDELSGMLNSGGTADIDFALTKLHVYALFHFSSEEHLLAKYGYPDFNVHVEEHLKFKAQIDEFKRQYANNKPELANQIHDYIEEWIKEHLLNKDKKYSTFLASKVKQ